MRRALLTTSLILAAIAPVAPGAAAGRDRPLHIATPVMRECADRLFPPEAPGAARRSWTADADGMLTASLDGGGRSDWDLAVFHGGAAAGASTALGSAESASVAVEAGDAVVAQACRLDGSREAVSLRFDFHPFPRRQDRDRISMESVAVSGHADVERLEELGLDVTHDVSPTEATVVLYDDAQRDLLRSAGFAARTVIPDLVAADNAQRSADLRAAAGARSALPSGRDTYRVYEDYTTELRALAQANPALVREVVLGLTFEGRPIQGVEIAEDVLRSDDGRPVYLNFGAHHAREWPSAEWPMEFAHTLVQGYNANDAGIRDLLAEVRVVIVPVVNVDGFIASRSHGFNPLTDDDANLTIGQIVANQGAYIRKNCRPTGPGDALIPCAQRSFSGVDLNRNYGYYWGGPGSTSDPTAQSYRGTGPFSEPESEAVHQYTSTIHPTVFITNHTFTEDGKWLRQPGFDAAFLPQMTVPGYGAQGCGPQSAGDQGAFTPDEAAMKELGDDMAAATGFTSELGYETLCDITGATEDWNYFAQGTYGYTPEARGTNFHMNYATGVVTEYLGDATHPGLGVREAYLIAGERAGDAADHGVIQGTAPPGATLKLTKEFEAPTFSQPGLNVDEHLETTLKVSAAGTYEWHVNPSDRPTVTGGPNPNPGDEQWTMTCQRPGGAVFTDNAVEVARNQVVTRDWGAACGGDTGPAPPTAAFSFSPSAPLVGQQVNFFDASTDADGAIDTRDWDLDGDGQFDDAAGLVASRSFPAAGTYQVGLRVTDDDGDSDTEVRTVLVSDPPVPLPTVPATPATAACRRLAVTVSGTAGDDVLRGTPGDDVFGPLAGDDRVLGLGGSDTACGGAGDDRLIGGSGADTLLGNRGDDRLRGGSGRDRCRGGAGTDSLKRCP